MAVMALTHRMDDIHNNVSHPGVWELTHQRTHDSAEGKYTTASFVSIALSQAANNTLHTAHA